MICTGYNDTWDNESSDDDTDYAEEEETESEKDDEGCTFANSEANDDSEGILNASANYSLYTGAPKLS